ncbi:MAG TPA: DUF6122 family protein, partial [Salinimicrobium sp.]|nr:DUF6122 family protein [Salinimicrobium sp.]
LLGTMLVDLDHLFADPIFEAGRCSVGFHYLHSEYIIPFYILGALFLKNKWIRLIFIGLVFHMLTDFIDCIWMYYKCQSNCALPEFFI